MLDFQIKFFGKFVFNFFYLIIFGISLYSQTSNVRVVEYKLDNVHFKAELNDLLYEYGDTLVIKYHVVNKNYKSAFIFDPNLFYSDSYVEPDYVQDNCHRNRNMF